jgi:tRNA 5-methylaminomethyl-2-thiouridine biosynthesis bifunctional protein
MPVLIIGAGLAAAACAHVWAQAGHQVQLLHGSAGASVLPVGLLAPQLSTQDFSEAQIVAFNEAQQSARLPLPQQLQPLLTRLGVACTLGQAARLLRQGQDWQPCQVRQRLLGEPDKNQRLRDAAALWPQWFSATPDEVIHLQAAWIKPAALVAAWLHHPLIASRQADVATLARHSQPQQSQQSQQWQAYDASGRLIAQAPQLIVAAGVGSAALLHTAGLSLELGVVDGQVALGSWPPSGMNDRQATQPINGLGHFIPAVTQSTASSFWLSGSTYEREPMPAAELRHAQGLQANHERLRHLLPANRFASVTQQFESGQVQAWQGSRCSTNDRLPVVGSLADGLYVCTAMGSRGLTFAAWCAQLLARSMWNTLDAGDALWLRALSPLRAGVWK